MDKIQENVIFKGKTYNTECPICFEKENLVPCLQRCGEPLVDLRHEGIGEFRTEESVSGHELGAVEVGVVIAPPDGDRPVPEDLHLIAAGEDGENGDEEYRKEALPRAGPPKEEDSEERPHGKKKRLGRSPDGRRYPVGGISLPIRRLG